MISTYDRLLVPIDFIRVADVIIRHERPLCSDVDSVSFIESTLRR